MERREFLQKLIAAAAAGIAMTACSNKSSTQAADSQPSEQPTEKQNRSNPKMKHMITIDKTRCIHCGLCIKDCTKGCLEFDADKVPQFNGEGCMGCQHCMAICPQGAISFDD